MTPASLNPVAPETVEDPFPFWAWLRREAPVHEVPGTGYFLVSRYADVRRVAEDSETFSSELVVLLRRDAAGEPKLEVAEVAGRSRSRVLGVADGEPHADQRRVVGRTFSPARMARLTSEAGEIVGRCLDGIGGGTEVDLVEALAVPLPRELMTRLLGLPLEDQDRLQHWTDHSIVLMSGLPSPEELAPSLEISKQLEAYLEGRFEEALRDPGGDVMGDLARAVLAARRGEKGLEDWEAQGVLFQLVVGGIETTVGLIANAIRQAAEIPGMWSRLRAEPELVSDFVEEVARLDAVAIGNYRRATRDTELAGVKLPKGSTLHLLWGSANRDEDEFAEPDRFRLGRENIKTHMAFGHGKHFCLGAALARMETGVALGALLERFERIELVDHGRALRHKPGLVIRRLASLRARLG
ncbi:MAG: cytochrome P450 [Deltaproteobacteria bacterium]|jgi:cytochrome P450|nr:cytochrome P450 [Deltaproteobacteria bacterium]MBW2496027.1 cytochrome P450 [Deltaproteobacteria bacterium]